MEIKPVSDSLYGFLILYDMHTQYFERVLADIKEKDATERLNTKANHIGWLAGSLVQQRFEFSNLLGVKHQSTGDELFKNHQGIRDDVSYPSLIEYKNDWNKISPILRTALLNVTEEHLAKILEFPGMSFSVFEMISFNTYREANQIGQLALWRRLLGYDGMKYD